MSWRRVLVNSGNVAQWCVTKEKSLSSRDPSRELGSVSGRRGAEWSSLAAGVESLLLGWSVEDFVEDFDLTEKVVDRTELTLRMLWVRSAAAASDSRASLSASYWM